MGLCSKSLPADMRLVSVKAEIMVFNKALASLMQLKRLIDRIYHCRVTHLIWKRKVSRESQRKDSYARSR